MNTAPKVNPRWRFLLKITAYGGYVDQLYRLEAALARRPARLQIDLVGAGEMPPDTALLVRSILRGRASRTRIITHARSSLLNSSVLVWLLGDTRLIREDAQLFFRRANPPEEKADNAWDDQEMDLSDLASDDALEEADYARVLELINEFLPVKEMAGRPIGIAALRHFGLVDHEKVDHFLADAFAKQAPSEQSAPNEVKPASAAEPEVPSPDPTKRTH